MSKIAFFCIPAQGHTNPTLEVVRELVRRGNEVIYYSYDSLKEKVESTGAKYLSCDNYDIQMNLKPEDAARIGKDIAFSIEILVNTTLAMDDDIISHMRQWKPDCIVADSMATWGKLAALKLGIPFISSTTTFAFNRYSAKIMKTGFRELMELLRSIPKANRSVKKLQEKGYPVKDALSIIQNDNDTNTIVYTSKEFQPCSDTFSEKYLFVGPSIRKLDYPVKKPDQKTVYISLGSVDTDHPSFFKNCIQALKNSGLHGILSVGDKIDLSALGNIPDYVRVERSVNQIEVLQQADVFLTHCGMNSVNEALYYQVPLLLSPRSSEQSGVAYRVHELGAGVYLKDDHVSSIQEGIKTVMETPYYKENAKKIAESFYRCGGAAAAADKIEKTAKS